MLNWRDGGTKDVLMDGFGGSVLVVRVVRRIDCRRGVNRRNRGEG